MQVTRKMIHSMEKKLVLFRIRCIFSVFLFVIAVFVFCSCTAQVDMTWVNVAHRGQAAQVTENTVAAISEAASDECGCVELDVRKTKDGALVLSHNADITGFIDGKKVTKIIDETDLAILKQMVLMTNESYGEIPIATLEEGLLSAKENNMEVALHFKTMEDDFIRNVAETVMNCGMSGKCMYNTNSDFEKYIPLILSVDEKASFHIPYTDELDGKTYASLTSDNSKIIITVDAGKLKSSNTEKVKTYGYKLYVWNVTKKNSKKAFAVNADYIEYVTAADVSDILSFSAIN